MRIGTDTRSAPVLVDFPRWVDPEVYRKAIERRVESLAAQDGVSTIYQIGHISTPGISDIDMVVVFQDSARCDINPLTDLDETERYLFIHSLFGARLEMFLEGLQVSCFHNYTPLWKSTSTPAIDLKTTLTPEDLASLKKQIALEYLVRAFLSLTVELVYGIVRVRNLFLHTKALLYDCEFLGVSTGPFPDAIRRVVEMRSRWFQNQPTRRELQEGVLGLYRELEGFLDAALQDHPLFLPPSAAYRVSRNIQLLRGDRLSCRHQGFVLPSRFAFLGKSYFNVQHRWNRFEIALPFRNENPPEIVGRAMKSHKRMREDNQRHLPSFMPLASSLHFR